MAAGCLADKSLPCGFTYFIYMHKTLDVAKRYKELNTVEQGKMSWGGHRNRFTSHFLSSTSSTHRLKYVSAPYCIQYVYLQPALPHPTQPTRFLSSPWYFSP